MIVDEELYLEHFGTKGMRWGQRKNRSSTSSTEKPQHTKLKVAAGVTAVAAIGIGAVYAKKLLNKHGAKIFTKVPKFDIAEQNKHLADMYKEGIIWDKPNMGRKGEKRFPPGLIG